jgi:surface antigen
MLGVSQMSRIRLGFLLFAISFLSACVSTGGSSDVASDLQVNKPGVATGREIVKAFDGGILPKTVYSKLSRKDKTRALLAEYRALENSTTGQSTYWENPNGKLSGIVTPSQPYQVGSRNCRQYSHKAMINGDSIEASGAACRTTDGRWIPLR